MLDPTTPCACDECAGRSRRSPLALMIGITGLLAWQLPAMVDLFGSWLR